jgi:RNA polymerase sigma-70 factor (ECF subfamily)
MSASSLAAALADAHGSAVRAYFRRAVGRPELAEDLAQEVFVRVLRFADGFEARGRDRAWLFTIAHRVLVDHLRSASRAPAATPSDQPPEAAAPPTQELRLVLQRALHALDGLDRDGFLMAEVACLTYAENAAVLDTTHAAVRSRVFRARLALRTGLASAAAVSPAKGPTS